MSLIKNASPQVLNLGTEDLSIRKLLPEKDPQPQHMPLFYIQARKGTTKKVGLAANKFIPMYGNETFNMNGIYYNHATRFLTGIAGTGNNCMVQRVVPTDAGPRSNIAIYVDVLQAMVPNYVRDSLGNYVVDSVTGLYITDTVTPQIPGTLVKYVSDYQTTDVDVGLLT